VGKTTLCAVWARLFADDRYDVLAIDADSNANLAYALGLPAQRRPKPLIEMKDLIAERVGGGKDAVGAYFRLNPEVGDLPEQYWVRAGNVKLLVLGAITQAGVGCACPQAAFLRVLLTHTVLQRRELVLVDLAAGVESMGRASIEGIDAFVLVVEPGSRSIETANNLAKMARQLGIKRVAAVANKVTQNEQAGIIEAELEDMVLLGAVGYRRSVQDADLRGVGVFEADKGFVKELARAKDELTRVLFGKVSEPAIDRVENLL